MSEGVGIDWVKIALSQGSGSLPATDSKQLDGRKPLAQDQAAEGSLPSDPSPPVTGDYKCFVLRNDKWEASDVFVMGLPVNKIWSGPYLIKVNINNVAHYFCGNDAVYQKLEGKENRRWIFDLLELIAEHVPVCPEFWEMDFKKALKLTQVHQILGGTFISMVPF